MVSIKEEDNDDNHNHKQEEPHNQQQQQQEEGKPQMESESSPLHPHLPPKRQQQKAPSRIPPALPPRSHLPQKPVSPQDEKPQMESHSQSSLLQSHLPPKPQVESHSKSSLLQSLLPPKPQMESQPHSSILHSHLPPKPHMESHSESSLAQSHLPPKPQMESQSSILHSHLPPKPHMESHSELSLAQSHLPPKLLPQRQQYIEEKPQIESQSSHLRSHLPTQLITQIEPAPHHENLSQIIAKDRRIHGFSPLHSPSQEDSFNNKKSIQLHQPLHSPSQDDSFNNKKSIQLHQHNLEPIQPNPVLNRSIREELAVVSKMDHGVNNDFPHASGVGGGGKRSVVNDGGDRRSKTVSSILRKEQREAMVNRAALGFRVCAAVFCLISFSVMAADKTQGWAGDSFDRHKEYRYCLAVGVIGFVYAGFQAFDLAYYLIAARHVIQSYLRCYFEFSMDQILTYLLISASSAAASRVDDWQSNWGKDEFTVMASASVGMSFLAFIAFAFSSLISGYNLCTQ